MANEFVAQCVKNLLSHRYYKLGKTSSLS